MEVSCFAGLLPDKIQRRDAARRSAVTIEGTRYNRTASGNRVNARFNSDGWNVNNWNDDNANPDLGLASARHFLLSSLKNSAGRGGGVVSDGFVALIQPPSIRPISSMICCTCAYFFRSMAFVSLARRTSMRSRLSCTLACSSGTLFVSLLRCPARHSDSITKRHCCSVLCHSPCLSCLGTVLRKPESSLYRS